MTKAQKQNYQSVPYTNVRQNQAELQMTLTAFTREGKVIGLSKMICRRCNPIGQTKYEQVISAVDKHLFLAYNGIAFLFIFLKLHLKSNFKV